MVLAENMPRGTGLRPQEPSTDLVNSGPTLERQMLPGKCETASGTRKVTVQVQSGAGA